MKIPFRDTYHLHKRRQRLISSDTTQTYSCWTHSSGRTIHRCRFWFMFIKLYTEDRRCLIHFALPKGKKPTFEFSELNERLHTEKYWKRKMCPFMQDTLYIYTVLSKKFPAALREVNVRSVLFLMSFCSILLALSNGTSLFLYDFPLKKFVKNTIFIPAQYNFSCSLRKGNPLCQQVGVLCVNKWESSVSTSGSPLCQQVGVLCVNKWESSVSTSGSPLCQQVGVLCVNKWESSVSTSGSPLCQQVGVLCVNKWESSVSTSGSPVRWLGL